MDDPGWNDDEPSPLARTLSTTSGEASELSSIFNLSNTILGSGTLAMPYACYQCGALVFVVLLVVVGVLANFSLQVRRGPPGAARRPSTAKRFPSQIGFLWGFCMGPQGA